MVNKARGTYDILPIEARKWIRLEEIIRRVCYLYNYEEIRTPIFEKGELFHRSNDTSDMVTKETYDFFDRNNQQLTLRPEGTACVVRAYIENKMHAENNLQKLYYIGPLFRYERPQKGRYRQFHQFGVEAFGSKSPLLDAEIIALAVALIKALGLKGIKVNINSIGDEQTRESYRNDLISHFSKHKDELCNDCLTRLDKNPLRVLDCKVDRHKEFFNTAPKIVNYLSEEAKEHFDKVLEALKALSIPYEIDDYLVRGLDYYTHTVFEIEIDIESFGAQNVICGGGRYDNLVSELGGVNTNAVGFAFGLERLLLALEHEGKTITKPFLNHLYIISLGEKAHMEALKVANICRMGGLSCEIDYQGRSIKGQFKQADRLNSRFTAIIGDDELANNTINVKDNQTDIQETISLYEIYPYVIKNLKCKTTTACQTCQEGKE